MPTIGVEKNAFLEGIGRLKATQEELENLFFDLGLELDDIEEENGKERLAFLLFCFFLCFFRKKEREEEKEKKPNG